MLFSYFHQSHLNFFIGNYEFKCIKTLDGSKLTIIKKHSMYLSIIV
jgi:hypothetical protein